MGFCDNSGFDGLREVICDLGFWVKLRIYIYILENWVFCFFGGFLWFWNVKLKSFAFLHWCLVDELAKTSGE